MTRYGKVERGIVASYTAVASRAMALPPQREHYPQFPTQVVDVVDLSPAFRRVVLQAPELHTLERMGPDEYVGVFMPRPGIELVLPENVFNPRSALGRIPEHVRPELRWYTIRAHRPDEGRLDLDIISRGHDGPGAQWINSVAPGDHVGLRVQTALYASAPPTGHHLLLADETGLPGILSILDEHAQRSADTSPMPRLTTLAEVPGADHIYDEVRMSGVDVRFRGDSAPGSALLPALRELTLGRIDYAWICAEGSTVAAAKKYLTKELGVPRRAITSSGFWRLGRARP
ncbi:siderophore-interacting protein [Gephyromycinifex aptenodytis]|uniref:siderophore-interacting protein n=1 Tax=Gephyromycinifex aptenodytis TaxID=2716227 RepID=UPI001444C4F4|nr:siderophore-interacting protein [Gephyromycinifex aptenodytis]